MYWKHPKHHGDWSQSSTAIKRNPFSAIASLLHNSIPKFRTEIRQMKWKTDLPALIIESIRYKFSKGCFMLASGNFRIGNTSVSIKEIIPPRYSGYQDLFVSFVRISLRTSFLDSCNRKRRWNLGTRIHLIEETLSLWKELTMNDIIRPNGIC